MPSDAPWEAALSRWAAAAPRRVCLVGIGNALKGDDGAGPELIRQLAGRTRAECVDAGVAPENHVERIARLEPELVVLVDAVDFGGAPGEVRIEPGSSAGGGGLSTHTLPLRMVSDYLAARLGREPVLLGIQPATIALGQPLAPPVAHAVARLAATLARAWPPDGGRRNANGAASA